MTRNRFLATTIVCAITACDRAAPLPVAPPISQDLAAPSLLDRATAGDATAQVELGIKLASGDGMPEDDVKAVEWWNKAAEQGNADAYNRLAAAFDEGHGVAKDEEQAIGWWRKGAETGNREAQANLGLALVLGKTASRDVEKGVEWIRLSADANYPSAQFILGKLYQLGTSQLGSNAIEKDSAAAAVWLQKAADQGHIDAQRELARAYGSGEGVARDMAKAFHWYEKAAIQGDELSETQLVTAYEKGIGIPRDDAMAMEWRLKTASRGGVLGSIAQLGIAEAFLAGRAGNVDAVVAYAWANIAATDLDLASPSRDMIAARLAPAERAEAARLSTAWKPGQIIVREAAGSARKDNALRGGVLEKYNTGTAFYVSRDGLAITNNHVVDGCKELRAAGRDGVLTIETADTVNDLALMRTNAATQVSAELSREPAALRQGDAVTVYGFPLNAVLSSGGNLTPGVVSALTGLGNNSGQIQITAPIQPGSSGSPVLNEKGEVVGVVLMKLSDLEMARQTGQLAQNVNFAVSGATLKAFLDTQTVRYETGPLFRSRRSNAEIAEAARKFTFVVECWR